MDLPKGKNQKESFWRGHIQQLEKFEGSNIEYCRINSLNPNALTYYKSKYKGQLDKKSKALNLFTPVNIVSNTKSNASSNLPDPVWLAQFLKEWFK